MYVYRYTFKALQQRGTYVGPVGRVGQVNAVVLWLWKICRLASCLFGKFYCTRIYYFLCHHLIYIIFSYFINLITFAMVGLRLKMGMDLQLWPCAMRVFWATFNDATPLLRFPFQLLCHNENARTCCTHSNFSWILTTLV